MRLTHCLLCYWEKRQAETITDADYADDLALLANTSALAKSLLPSLEQVAKGINVYVNTDKKSSCVLIKMELSH